MPAKEPNFGVCCCCQKRYPLDQLVCADQLRPSLTALIRQDLPDWGGADYICRDDLMTYRQRLFSGLLSDEAGELGAIEARVAEVLAKGELLTPETIDPPEPATLGERLADRVAEWGGSWGFILGFLTLILCWMAFNSLALLRQPFDPYPFILLNLLLSCLAAFQAPIIMMSQRRQELKDRRRAENDYIVNLKAEIELRQLHEKIDHQIAHQWQRLLEVQQIQIDLLKDLTQAQNGK